VALHPAPVMVTRAVSRPLLSLTVYEAGHAWRGQGEGVPQLSPQLLGWFLTT
jgi:hypothetical protein